MNDKEMATASAVLFRQLEAGGLSLRNRIVMAPMTRLFAQDGVPDARSADYYARRAEGGTGLIITEGTCIPHHAASYDRRAPDFHGEAALARWQAIAKAVQSRGAAIIPQLWHVGLVDKPRVDGLMDGAPAASGVGPSGLMGDGRVAAEPMSTKDIDDVIAGYATAAASARTLGFDGVEIHGAHGYLIDQFLWPVTNRRSDSWGGDLAGRMRMAVEVVRACRAATGPDFPIIFRFSQWKQQDYAARLFEHPRELEQFVTALAGAGVSLFHPSTRRFWEIEFADSELTLAGWTRKLSGLPTIAVGSVGLDGDFISSMFENRNGMVSHIDELLLRMEQDEFDLVALGRSLISNPEWPRLVQQGRMPELRPYDPEALLTLD